MSRDFKAFLAPQSTDCNVYGGSHARSRMPPLKSSKAKRNQVFIGLASSAGQGDLPRSPDIHAQLCPVNKSENTRSVFADQQNT
jgi:hypothetical protein